MDSQNNSSQIGHSPTEKSFPNNSDETNFSPMLSSAILITSQPIIPTNPNIVVQHQPPFIHDHLAPDVLARRLEGRRRRRRRQRQRRNERRRQEREEQRQREQQRGRRQRQREQWRRLQRQQQRARQLNRPRPQPQPRQTIVQMRYQQSRAWFEREVDYEYSESVGYPSYMYELDEEQLSEEYEWEKMDPKQRWEHEQVNEFEAFAALEQLLFLQDQIEQEHQINTVQTVFQEEQEARNQQQEVRNQAQVAQLELIEDELEQEKQLNTIQEILEEEEQRQLQLYENEVLEYQHSNAN